MLKRKLELINTAQNVAKESGKSYFSQLREIVEVRLGFCGLGADDYYTYELYNSRFTQEDRLQFVGWRGQRIIDRLLNDPRWHFAHSDKITTALLLERLGIPVPPIVAAFDFKKRVIPGCDYLQNEAELETFLRKTSYPLFVKPVDNALGRNTCILYSLDAESGVLRCQNDRTMTINELYKMCHSEASEGRGGMIFQPVVKPAPEVARLTGGKLAGLRIILLNVDKPEFTHAILKIPVGQSITDNFRGGESGNLLARVNLESGVVESAFGLRDGRFTKVEVHPDTGEKIISFQLPQWQECKAHLVRAASAFPGMKLQHWDYAISDKGPVALELNGDGCVQLPQIAYERGFFAGPIKDAVLAARTRI